MKKPKKKIQRECSLTLNFLFDILIILILFWMCLLACIFFIRSSFFFNTSLENLSYVYGRHKTQINEEDDEKICRRREKKVARALFFSTKHIHYRSLFLIYSCFFFWYFISFNLTFVCVINLTSLKNLNIYHTLKIREKRMQKTSRGWRRQNARGGC